MRKVRIYGDSHPRTKAKDTRIVQDVTIDGRRYRQTYVCCGKPCRRCDGTAAEFDAWRPGHGPYWYRIIVTEKKTIMRYIGKELRIEGQKGEKHGNAMDYTRTARRA
jgi:hypothetical protein